MPAATTNIPFYKQARNLTSLRVWGGNADASGVVTWGTPVDISTNGSGGVRTFEAFTLSQSKNQVSLRPADSYYENMANEYITYSATISEVAPANGVGNLNAMALGYDYIRIIATYRPIGASSSADMAVGIIGTVASSDTGIQQGKNVDTLTVSPAGLQGVYLGLLSAMPSTF